jgi:type IV pilus assembly protein PilE
MNSSSLIRAVPSKAHGRSDGRAARPTRQLGVTLIELMIVVAIVAILSAIAYPAYISHVVKAKRVAAEGCMSQYSNYMERWYTTNLRYDKDSTGTNAVTWPALDCATQQQTGLDYQYALTPASLTTTTYEITATPQGAQLTRDTLCGTLKLNQAGTRTPTTTGCW